MFVSEYLTANGSKMNKKYLACEVILKTSFQSFPTQTGTHFLINEKR